MNKVRTIVLKEWSEVFRNRLVLFTVGFLPLIFLALPLLTLISIGSLSEDEAGMGELAALTGGCEGFSAAACGQIYLLDIYNMMFMILPVAIPVTIAAYSIVGEKTMRSLEPLLATPITTVELLVGKALAAIIPAVAATWGVYAIYLLIVRFFVLPGVVAHLTSPLWLVAIVVVAPLLTLAAVNLAIIISSRVNDPRVAEQISVVIILPIILFIVGQSAGVLLLNERLILVFAAVVFVLDVGLTYLGIRLFERETILTRWK